MRVVTNNCLAARVALLLLPGWRMNTWKLSLAIVLVAGVAHADVDSGPSQPTDARDHSRVGATVGIATPVGEVGVEYTWAALPALEIGLGAGIAMNMGPGVAVLPQASVMPRFRVRRGAVTFTVGSGLSGGEFQNVSPFAEQKPVTALWANAEAGIQFSSSRGRFVRLFAGAGLIVAHSTPMSGSEYAYAFPTVLPSIGAQVGFGL